MSWEGLVSELETLFGRGVGEPLSDDDFTRLALRVFAHQYGSCDIYRAFCQARSATPGTIEVWQDVPAVPSSGFKHVDLLSAPEAEAVFVTSGTSKGAAVRGRHPVPRLSLYRAAAIPNFRAHLLPDGDVTTMLSLIPSPGAAPESSLSNMIGMVSAELVLSTRWLAEGPAGVDIQAFLSAAEEAVADDEPVLLVGTAFAFVRLVDALESGGQSLALPNRSRIMETGGFKGRSRSLERGALYRALEERLGVPSSSIVNEYGMTELLSQLYEPVLLGPRELERRHVPPPWLRVRALDPNTLAPLGPGEEGLLAFFDLANVGSVAHVLTEDVGAVTSGAVRLHGRSPGAEPRGCSLAMEDLLDVAGG
jgi:hypothetical protein